VENDKFYENYSSMVLRVAIPQYNADIMPQGWRTKFVDGVPIEVIKTPYFPQSPEDKYCYVCSLKMVLSYFKNEYPNRVINENTPDLSIKEIKNVTKTRGRGGTKEQNLVKELEVAVPTLKFELIKDGNFNMIKDLTDKGIPVIVLYCGDYLLNRERGGGHAGVAVKVTADKIILNNPWFGYEYIVDRSDFQEAWELEYRAFIKITPTYQTRLAKTMAGVSSSVN